MSVKVSKVHIDLADSEKMEMMKTGDLMALIPFVEKVVRQTITTQDILCVNKFWSTKYEIFPLRRALEHCSELKGQPRLTSVTVRLSSSPVLLTSGEQPSTVASNSETATSMKK